MTARVGRALAAGAAICVIALATLRERRARGEEPAVEPAVPRGMVAYFAGGVCPPGWQPAAEVEGRLVVGVGDPSLGGVTMGAPLGDREDRAHTHTLTTTAMLKSKDVVAFDGSNDDGAAATSYTATGSASAQTSGLPFVQVQACVRP